VVRQLLLVVDGGRVTTVYDTSTGSVAGTTPVGHWSVTREIDGFRQSDLGLLYRPKYFHEGWRCTATRASRPIRRRMAASG